MPHATYQYQFEWKIFDWAGHFSSVLTGSSRYPFLLVFVREGVVSKVIVGDRPGAFDHAKLETLKPVASAWLLYDPFDGPEYIYIKWYNVNRNTMERITNVTFESADFVSNGAHIEFPTSWGVMF